MVSESNLRKDLKLRELTTRGYRRGAGKKKVERPRTACALGFYSFARKLFSPLVYACRGEWMVASGAPCNGSRCRIIADDHRLFVCICMIMPARRICRCVNRTSYCRVPFFVCVYIRSSLVCLATSLYTRGKRYPIQFVKERCMYVRASVCLLSLSLCVDPFFCFSVGKKVHTRAAYLCADGITGLYT